MKQFYPLVALLSSSTAIYSQVGINTATPTSTLEVVAKNATGATTNVDGLLIPRVDRLRAQSMTAIPISTMIFVNNVTTGSQTGIAATMDAVGYYYYSGLGWVKLENPNGTVFSSVNIYNTNGTLTGNRIVNQGANTLAFTGTAVNAFSVDNTTLSIDATNKRIGVGTTTPKQQIHITEAGATSGIAASFISGLAVTGTASAAGFSGPGFYLENTSAAAGSKLLKMNYSLNTTEPIFNFQAVSDDATTSISQILTLTRSGKLGINATPNPASNLAVNGNAAIGNGYIVTAAPANGAIIQGNVGIGTPTPVAKVDIVGTTFGIKNAVGSGSWDNLWFNVTPSTPSINASGAESGLQFNVGTNSVGTYGDGQTLTTVATMLANGNMGVGSTVPTRKLHVEGSEYLNAAVTVAATRNALDINIGEDGFTYGNRTDNFGINIRSASTVGTGPVARINFGDTNTTTAGTGKYLSFSVGNGLNELMYLTDTNSGRVGIGTIVPTSMLSVNGTADKPGGGTWGTFSDKRVKKDINDFKDGLNIITQLHPVTYKYNEKSGYKDLDKEYVGFIAQEVEKAAPYMVKTIDDSSKSGLKDKRELDESALTKILVNAVKELEKQVKDLQLELKSLKSQKKN
ncbi:tail fiber domain-containing protein [Chryseobacterium polytrichastri]|uniref:Chaperone of endosialidase n=1 Tax=Chryseobacterium polytrichastri TaxID=1302687 RepID=A0A1M7KIY9_9FLAO|nr:tail fiber domain-containing protein [Chryseobacterium polytrichastri]SHM65342.1 Chaperone of endosialidase [Chryseobacterium polytrichastri]